MVILLIVYLAFAEKSREKRILLDEWWKGSIIETDIHLFDGV
jgi:hypothetical protein